MNRRDFLRLRTTPKGRTLDLSCHSLYVQYLDALRASTAAAPAEEYEPWMGEPPTVFHGQSVGDLLGRVEQDLRNADVLRVLDSEWLQPTELGPQLEPLLAAFRARGGRIEFVQSSGDN